ncbi:MAG: CCA tRNA nucleotidyltransferase [Syntrophobacteraceae bacterium]
MIKCGSNVPQLRQAASHGCAEELFFGIGCENCLVLYLSLSYEDCSVVGGDRCWSAEGRVEIGISFVPDDVLRVMEKIHKAGADVWVVGGALRDFLLEIEPKDWDVATSATTGKIISLFPRVIPVGIRHGTVQVHTSTRDIEVTSFEPPGEAGILKDLGRRDFTMNSLALSYPDGVLIDPHRGREDLKTGLIRAVGNPRDRFSEDPLRIVRAARICGIYGFKIDLAAFDAMRELSAKLQDVSGERIRDEILKILLSANTSGAFDLLRKSGALAWLLPGLDAAVNIETRTGSGVSIFTHTLACIINCPEIARIRLAALFHEIAASNAKVGADGQTVDFRRESARGAEQTMKMWNMSNRSIHEVSTLVAHQLPQDALSWSDARIRRFITAVHPELIDDFIALAEAEVLSGGYAQVGIEGIRQLRSRMKTQIDRISALSVRELALSGDDIMKMLDLPPGREVGKVLDRLFDLVQEDPDLNTRARLSRIVEAEKKSGI